MAAKDTPLSDRSDAVRRRLEKRLHHTGAPRPRGGPIPAPADFTTRRQPVELTEATDGSEIRSPHGEAAFLVETRIVDLPGGWESLCRKFTVALADPGSPLRSHLQPLGCFTPADFLFLDLETTGLSSTPVFLIGVMVWEKDSFVVRQYFARTYAEERAILSCFASVAQGRKLLVSFNGKSFDLPYVHARAAACGLNTQIRLPHCDLLHLSRRVWKDRLPNCRLQTLETYICHRGVRSGDIDGALIPAAYHDYVRTNDARQMVQCLSHNRLDLITLADLMTRLPPP